ncbi:toprim domain-containing protein [Rufibacter sediminis]|uniref:Toprim domain-containing protein n=1 Tax=Rufibacter sediminis TaxID=2762756 RepID=A0ABR6VPW0_9BACT|nr:toprim domain-containing protein [Rufibacter sediminis]MBC3538957.1 toprim domain-containing protein [Rufibacter sediminis]
MEDFRSKYPDAKSFEDFRREISIIELATANGYHHEVKKGSRTPVFFNPQTNDRIIILNPANPGNQGYWNPEDDTDKGSLIHFVKRRLGTLFPQNSNRNENANVNSILYNYLKLPEPARQRNRQLVDTGTLHNIEAHPFLIDYYQLKPLYKKDFFRERGISLETLEKPEFIGRIYNVQYQDPAKPGPVYTNVAFPYHLAHDTRMVGLEIRNRDYKAHAEGSDRSNGVWHSNMPQKLDRIVLVESAVDALSYRELRQPQNTLFVSYGGNLTSHQIQTIKELKAKGNTGPDFKYVAANDNDQKGAYYDLMFLRELAAEQFPSQRLANPKNIFKLAFSSLQTEPGALVELADRLMRALQPYHAQIDEELRKEGIGNVVKNELEKDKIKFNLTGNQFIVEIPTTFFALHQFNQALVSAAGLEKNIKIEKAVLNDYNEDLKLIKAIHKNPELLADINRNDLKKSPGEKLTQDDLKFVVLQPGRYEQLQKTFGLGKENEESQQILQMEKKGEGVSDRENKEVVRKNKPVDGPANTKEKISRVSHKR